MADGGVMARELVSSAEVWQAVRALEADERRGAITPEAAARRIARCKRAVTRQDLWKASEGRAGVGRPRGGGVAGFVSALVDGLQSLLPFR
jgi:hypothetical protein